MTAPGSTATAALTDLLHACAEGERGFHAAAERLEDPTLRQLCETYAEQRAAFKVELIDELAGLGQYGDVSAVQDDPQSTTTLRAPVTLAELARRDAVAESTYRRALDRGLPVHASETVERQHRQLSDAAKHLSLVQQAWPVVA